MEYPSQYLHVTECRSGETWIVPMRGNASFDLAHQIRKWVKAEFCGELFLDGKLCPIDGDYYAKIMTDGRPPDSVICWTSGGFTLTSERNALLR